MFFLAGAAAGGAMDLIGSLTKSLSGSQTRTGGSTGATQAGSPFDPAAGQAGAATSSAVGATPGTPSMTPITMDALLRAQGQQSGADSVSSHLFSLLDGDGNGVVSKAEFTKAFAQSGDTARVDGLFARLDKNGDGSIGPIELSAALKGGHHRHRAVGQTGATGESGGASDGTSNGRKSGSTSQSLTNADGSVTTTITYADGTKVSMIKPASNSTAANALERMIQRQAQMLGASSAGQSLAVTA